MNLLRVVRDIYVTTEAGFARQRLTDAKWSTLLCLYTAPGGALLPSEIAARLVVTRGAVSGILKGLEREGHISRLGDAADARRAPVRLTRKARALLKRELPPHFARIARFMAVLDAREQQSLHQTLAKLSAAVGVLRHP